MHNNVNKDIIAALATPYGRSAIAAIRISGDGCKAVVEGFLRRPLVDGRLSFNTFDTGAFTENLTAVYYRAPRSFTGEDTVELFPHGNMTVCDGIIKALFSVGIRAAERGEFTERAFINGKLDLMQCEALADIIDAETPEQLVYGNKRYNNEFKSLSTVRKLLNTALSTVEAVLHYGDELEKEDIDDGIPNDVYTALDTMIAELRAEKDKYASGRMIKNGFRVALIGLPNVGKSTLLNALTDSDRAIVTAEAGTTRDTLDGEYIYRNRKFIVTDTAGLNEKAVSEAEKIGIERARRAAADADAVITVVNGNNTTDIKGYADAENKTTEQAALTVRNKCDGLTDSGIDYAAAERGGALEVSAKNGINITALKEKIYSLCPKELGGICNHRQYDCVIRCLDACEAAKRESGKAEGLEIVAALLYEAYTAVAELYGENADEAVIDSVFSRFCVGK